MSKWVKFGPKGLWYDTRLMMKVSMWSFQRDEEHLQECDHAERLTCMLKWQHYSRKPPQLCSGDVVPLHRGLTLSKKVLFKVDSATASCYTTCEGDTPRKHVVVPEGRRFEQAVFKRRREGTSNSILLTGSVRAGRGLPVPQVCGRTRLSSLTPDGGLQVNV